MRSFLILLTFVFVPVGAAFCLEKPTVEVKGDYWRPVAESTRPTQTAGRFAWASRPLIRRPSVYLSPSDTTCYTMRSMLVAKEPGSDATDIVGQRTCTPSSRFQMKQSVQHPK
jgi:hypothetical protein